METYHIAMATDCPLDQDFFKILEIAAHKNGLTTYRVQPYNLKETIRQLRSGQIRFLSYYDRASDTSPEFLKRIRLLCHKKDPVLKKQIPLIPDFQLLLLNLADIFA